MLLGIIVLVIACLCQGSFAMGYKKYTPFSWAGFWGVYCLCCIVISSLVPMVLLPHFTHMVGSIPIGSYVCGAAWGLSAICFSKGIGRVGVTMVYGISMGVSTIVGTITPILIGTKGSEESISALMIVGMCVTILGILLFTIAGMKRDGKVKKDTLGYGMAILSGLGSGAMNLGFYLSDRVKNVTGEEVSYLGLSAIKWFPVLVGGLAVSVLWCVIEVWVKKEWNTVFAEGAIKRTGILFLVGIIWYAALLLYGLSTSMLSDTIGGAVWILFNAISLMISVVWGILSGEWKNHKKTGLYLACTVLIISLIIIAQ